MPPSSRSSMQANTNTITVGDYQFISVQAPDGARNHVTRRQVRSHAVKQAIKNKRKLEQDSGDNFRITTSQGRPEIAARPGTPIGTMGTSPFSLSAGMLDPFQTLVVDSSRLQTLLANNRTWGAPEPVFSFTDELAFQGFRSVFRNGLNDPALSSAVMLSLTFTAAGGSVNRECLGYQGQAIGYVRERMDSLTEAASESTIGAILLLAGVEARLGMTSQVQLHMGAVHLLLKICQKEGVYLTDGIKRAIFWQDLNSSVLAGSSRIVDHTTFSELQWVRDPFSPSFFRLPPGFQKRAHLFTTEFIEVLEDLHALQCIRNVPFSTAYDATAMVRINNHTASIQSRLTSLRSLSPVMLCCRIAAYLCSVTLCCKIWCALVIPPHVSSQLLDELQKAKDDTAWDEHPDLLLWILYIGGAFAPEGALRSEYISLLRSNSTSRFRNLYKSWPELIAVFEQFIWSEKAFLKKFELLREEHHNIT
ncbi:hypothetical protein F4802DRAFT_606757 [Xylaria palmicola]|nr:hypothetical protein F4802DRAFT_606757 [Xylaria palmicola]